MPGRPRLVSTALVLAACAAAALSLDAQSGTVTITVDAAQNRRPINPFVYGVAYATDAQLADLNVPLHRYGGNNTSRYNWRLNADNRGQDWYFESIGDSSATSGQRGDAFITSARVAGAQPMLTIPLIDWVAKLGAGRAKLASFNSTKYGAQDDCDWQWFAQACNGLKSGVAVVSNDPNDANVPNSDPDAAAWAQHLVATFGTAANGGLKYYILDNEHSLWHSTHRDVHPNGAGMDEVLDKMRRFALALKTVDPGAQIVGPEEWGWSGYLFSGMDQQYGSQHGWSFLPDRTNHAGMDYLPWLLQQLKAASQTNGVRLLDVFTVHYYPQGGEFSNDTSSAMQATRNRSTRSLWDPAYTDTTWINDKVQLIPRLRNWVNTYYYAGTPVGITEYNWGAEGHINGATTQADILGIFGREGLDMAARWTTPDTATPTYRAMKLYRNYDGNKSGFGDTSIKATATSNPDTLSVFAAQRSTTNAITLMVINKVSTSAPLSVSLANVTAGTPAQAWQVSGTNAIARLTDVPVSANAFSATVPGQSITLFVIPVATGSTNQPPSAPANLTASASSRTVTLRWTDTASNESGFSVERAAKAKALTWARFATTGANVTAWAFTESPGTWAYRVQASNAAGISGYSNTATLRVR